MKRATFVLALLGLLLLTSSALAMQSANFRLDWFTPLDSSGGGEASSASYIANITIGQTAIYPAYSNTYAVSLGYWYQVLEGFWRVFLPLLAR